MIRFLNAAKAFKLHCRQSQVLDENRAVDSEVSDSTSALRAGLPASKKPLILTERVPTSLLPNVLETVNSAASSMAAVLAAHHPTPPSSSRDTVSRIDSESFCSLALNSSPAGQRCCINDRQRLV
jgi:hypothetical protein